MSNVVINCVKFPSSCVECDSESLSDIAHFYRYHRDHYCFVKLRDENLDEEYIPISTYYKALKSKDPEYAKLLNFFVKD